MFTRILAPWAKQSCHQLGITPTEEFIYVDKVMTGWKGWLPIASAHITEVGQDDGKYLKLRRSMPATMIVVNPCEVAAFHWMYQEALLLASEAYSPATSTSTTPISNEVAVTMLFAWMYKDNLLKQWEWELLGEYFAAHPNPLNMTTMRRQVHTAINTKLVHVGRISQTQELYVQNF